MNDIPHHVGLIPDGTRRWSRRNGVSLVGAYITAMEKLSRIIDYLLIAGVQSVSVYMLSIRNLGRTPEELSAVFEAESWFCCSMLPRLLHEHNVRVCVIGDTSVLPEDFRSALANIPTSADDTRKVYLLVGYDSWQELKTAMNGISSITELRFKLAVPEDVDLIIRTGGGVLLSGFLPLQSQYAHIFTTDALFNDLSIDDVKSVLAKFARYTKLKGR